MYMINIFVHMRVIQTSKYWY